MLSGMPEGLLKTLERLTESSGNSFQTAEWLESSFEDDVWRLRFGKVLYTINWKVAFGGSALTDRRHGRVLRVFKSWLIAQTHPTVTHGRLLSNHTARLNIRETCRLIDYFILNDADLKLSKYGFSAVTENDLVSLLYRFEIGPTDFEAIYQWPQRLAQWLDGRLETCFSDAKEIVQKEAWLFQEISVPTQDWMLTVDAEKLHLWRAVLWLDGHYKRARALPYHYTPRTSRISRLIYSNTIAGLGRKPIPEELCLEPQEKYSREYPGVDVRTHDGSGPSDAYVRGRRRNLFSMSALAGTGLDVPVDALDAARETDLIHPEISVRVGRFRNPPIKQVLSGIRNGTDFALEYGEDLFESYVRILQAAKAEGVSPRILTTDHDIRDFLPPSIVRMGVNQWCLRFKARGWNFGRPQETPKECWVSDQYFAELRSGRGLLQNINVLYGGIQHVIGPLTARRQAELLRLSVRCCTDFAGEFLVFRNGKSGVADLREEEARPIPPVVKTQIKLIEKFHERLVEIGEIKAPGLLFSMPGVRGLRVPTVSSFNDALDIFADFFNTPLNSAGLRYYLREHQFRRFLIIVFFYGARQNNLETLRWFIGHTDAAHLWHYLTNTVSGDMRREAAAFFLMDELHLPEEERVIEMHDFVRKQLEDWIEVQFGTRSFALVDADALEVYLSYLLRDKICVEPVFFPAPSREPYKILISLRGLK